MPVSGKVAVHIGRGENHDRLLTYHNVVRRWIKLGDWTGQAATYTVARVTSEVDYSLKDVDRLDVVVQSGIAEARLDARRRVSWLLRLAIKLIFAISSKKIGPAHRRPEALGIEPYAELKWPADRTPGGWGAEESGART